MEDAVRVVCQGTVEVIQGVVEQWQFDLRQVSLDVIRDLIAKAHARIRKQFGLRLQTEETGVAGRCIRHNIPWLYLTRHLNANLRPGLRLQGLIQEFYICAQ